MKAKTYYYDLFIREHHLDSFGHVNNATYLEILEEARWEIITANGYGIDTIKKTGIGPVILEVKLSFRREILNRQNIRIESHCTSYRGKIGHFHQKIFNEQKQLCCEADFSIALFDLKARKLVTPTPEWLASIGVE